MQQMTDSRIISVLEGGMLQPDFGLSSDDLDLIRQRAHIVVHSASPMALLSSLAKFVSTIIDATERLAQFALE